MIGVCVRRLHVPPGSDGEMLRCPDCGKVLCRVGEIHVGEPTMLIMCSRCKDSDGSSKVFTIILHSSTSVYASAIKIESRSPTCDSALLLEGNLG